MEGLGHDLRLASRGLLKSRGIAAAAVVTLALGIGANTAIFSVVNAVLVKPLGYVRPDELVVLFDTEGEMTFGSVSFTNYVDRKARLTSFSSLAASTYRETVGVGGPAEPEPVRATRATASWAPVLGVSPAAGRWFTPDEDRPGGPPAAVLSYGLWRRLYPATPPGPGGDVLVDGLRHTVVGVMPDGFEDPQRSELWRPMAGTYSPDGRGNNNLRVIGRLAPGVSLARARLECDAVGARLMAEAGHRRGIRPIPLREVAVGGRGKPLVLLLGAVGFVLLIACANVANLMLARVAARRQDLAVMTALGASRLRLVRPLLVEGLALASLGAVLGLGLAAAARPLLLGLVPAGFPGGGRVGLDATVLAFTLGVTVLTALLASLAPARSLLSRSGGPLLAGATRTTSSRSGRIASRALVAAEIALALVVVVGAGLLTRSLRAVLGETLGLSPKGVLTVEVALPASTPDEEAARKLAALEERLAAVPGAAGAGGISYLPLVSQNFNGRVEREGRPFVEGMSPIVEMRVISPGYVAAMGMRVLKGRGVAPSDVAGGAPVVIVNDSLARRFWPGEEPLGKRLKCGLDDGAVWREVVGVLADVRSRRLEEAPPLELFVPLAQRPVPRLVLAVRARDGRAAALAPAVRQAMREVLPGRPIAALRPMDEVIALSVGDRRFVTLLTSLFALLAAGLAALGVHGLVSHSVARRSREIGVRVAVGADAKRIVGLVVGEGLLLAAAGAAAGSVLALVAGRLLRSQLYQVGAADPLVLATTVLALGAVVVAASCPPALRAARVDPVVALRSE